MEPAEDYDLWVKLAAIGKLHNLQECLLLYRVHKAQVSAIRSKKQKEAANQVRLKALQPLNTILTSAEKAVYLKAVESTENLKFNEFTILLDLKIKLIAANRIEYFNAVRFEKFWRQFEEKFICYYFTNRKEYPRNLIKQYVLIFNKLSNKLSCVQTIKLLTKSVIKYKVK
jgi:hypothetical protein